MPHTPPEHIRQRQGYKTEPFRKFLLFFTPLRWIQLVIFVLIFFALPNCEKFSWVQSIDNKIYDQFLLFQPAPKISPAVVYIGIDRKSLQSIKPFPWPKRYYAAMGKVLREWGAKAIIFNLFFSQEGDTADDNKALLEEFRKENNLYLPMSFESEGFRNYYFANKSDPVFAEQAKSLGHINYSQDPDGVIRRVFPFVKFNQKLIPHLGLKVAYDYLGKPMNEFKDCDFPRDENNNLLIHWTKKWKDGVSFYPFSDVLNAYAFWTKGQKTEIRPEDFKDKICLIGLTASDLKRTPLDSESPGIGVTGNLINTILTGEYIRVASPIMRFLIIFILSVASALFFLPFRKVFSGLGAILLTGGWVFFAFFMFSKFNLWLGVFTPILLVLSYFLVSWMATKATEYQEQLQLLNLAARDELTGLYEMRYISTFLLRAMDYATAFKKPFSVILFDIDNFKKINDEHGYRTGNMVLQKVAAVIQSAIRTKYRAMPDTAGRYGDEEFIVLLVGYNLATATFGIAERIRKAIGRIEFKAGEKTFKITASAGISVLGPGEKDPIKVIDRAQAALLRAKAAGKNQTGFPHD